MDRIQALEELMGRLTNRKLIRHSLAVEAIMRELAEHFKEDANKWAMAGLLHDIDYDRTASNMAMHGIVAADILETLGVDDEIVYAVKAHNACHGIPRNRRIDKALYAANAVSGFILEEAPALPSGKLEEANGKALLEKLKEESFRREEGRELLTGCNELGMPPEELVDIALGAVKKISGEPGI